VPEPDLAAYLRARLAEEEQVAAAALEDDRHLEAMGMPIAEPASPEIADHIPVRMAAEVAAKRAVLALYELSIAETKAERDWAFLEAPMPPMPTRALPLGSTRGLELAVQALAQVFATRDDFDPSWRTSG
jgi:hypothetical protein